MGEREQIRNLGVSPAATELRRRRCRLRGRGDVSVGSMVSEVCAGCHCYLASVTLAPCLALHDLLLHLTCWSGDGFLLSMLTAFSCIWVLCCDLRLQRWEEVYIVFGEKCHSWMDWDMNDNRPPIGGECGHCNITLLSLFPEGAFRSPLSG